jgi:hypothetical protein
MVYLAQKDGGVVHHTNLKAMRDMDGIETPEMSVPDEIFEAAGSLVRVIAGQIVVGKTSAETAAEEAATEIVRIKAEIEARDYRALKAQKLGEDLDTLYPGESAWYREQLDRIKELEAVIAATN